MLKPILTAIGVVGGMGALFGIVLAFAAKVFHVDQDERIPLVRECLPGANCGGCGYPGCDALSEAIVAGEAPVNKCPVGGAAVAALIAPIMGVEATETVRYIATLACNGTSENCKGRYEYYGQKDCREAAAVQGGPKSCDYGCMGFGSCVKACQFDAIIINSDGIAEVDKDKCTGCGACVKICPKTVLSLQPDTKQVEITCNNRQKGRVVRDTCKVGCYTCNICERQCPEKAIVISDATNLPVIDYSKCTGCQTCVQKCPQHSINPSAGVARIEEQKSA